MNQELYKLAVLVSLAVIAMSLYTIASLGAYEMAERLTYQRPVDVPKRDDD